ncbi:MAG: non-heme iron oxygenase ferredoxin subunit [Candidatus Aenigmarchaeota archaeon]|nr:non-heme iron oxygenase ferredoxin subunit [Candidatus Aenigmarchaeota archaeon]
MARIKIASAGELRPGQSKVVETDAGAVALFNVGGSFFATSNTCLHKGGPLGEGSLDNSVVTCPWHGWQYDITTGENLTNPSQPVRTHKVVVENGSVFLEI